MPLVPLHEGEFSLVELVRLMQHEGYAMVALEQAWANRDPEGSSRSTAPLTDVEGVRLGGVPHSRVLVPPRWPPTGSPGPSARQS